jgi:anti-sigma B factor antagonist
VVVVITAVIFAAGRRKHLSSKIVITSGARDMTKNRIDIEEISGITVVKLLEKKILDEANIEELGRELFALVETNGHRKLILEFSDVEYLSSAALGKLITLHKKVGAAKGKLVLCGIVKEIHEVFKITQLDRILTICADLDGAIAKF